MRNSPLPLIALAEILSYRLYPIGFYSDDWHHLFIMRGGFWSFADSPGYWTRPLQIIQFPALYWLVGDSPWIGQVILCGLGILEGWLLFKVLEKITGDSRLALAASILAVMFPIRIATHLWISNTSQLIAHCLILGSMLLSFSGRRLGSSIAALCSGLTYESAMFAPLMLLADNEPRRHWHFIPCLLTVVAWQFLVADNPKGLEITSTHIVDVYWNGLLAVFMAPVELIKYVLIG